MWTLHTISSKMALYNELTPQMVGLLAKGVKVRIWTFHVISTKAIFSELNFTQPVKGWQKLVSIADRCVLCAYRKPLYRGVSQKPVVL